MSEGNTPTLRDAIDALFEDYDSISEFMEPYQCRRLLDEVLRVVASQPAEWERSETVTDTEAIIERAGLRVMQCDSCSRPCLADKRSLCCGDSVRALEAARTAKAQNESLGASLDARTETRGEWCMKHLGGSSCVVRGRHVEHRNEFGQTWPASTETSL